MLLLAVPESGKTTVLISRLGYMIFCKNIRTENILTVTYTVAATNDMKERFFDKFGTEYANRVGFRTINGISQKIIQYYRKNKGEKTMIDFKNGVPVFRIQDVLLFTKSFSSSSIKPYNPTATIQSTTIDIITQSSLNICEYI